jgi:hypothetical protein
MCQPNHEIQYKPSAFTREKEFPYIATKMEVQEHSFSIKNGNRYSRQRWIAKDAWPTVVKANNNKIRKNSNVKPTRSTLYHNHYHYLSRVFNNWSTYQIQKEHQNSELTGEHVGVGSNESWPLSTATSTDEVSIAGDPQTLNEINRGIPVGAMQARYQFKIATVTG